MSSDYDFRPKGSLKLKGVVAEGGIVKKKKKTKSKYKEQDDASLNDDQEKRVEALEQAIKEDEVKEVLSSGAGRESPAVAGGSGGSDKKTAAEKRFEDVQRKRLAARVTKLANKSHKDRVHEFNSKLEALSEHHDIPKVGPG